MFKTLDQAITLVPLNPTNLNNAVAIGTNSTVSKDNSVILGSTNSSVGIGNSAPKNKLEIT
jgi:hypothetical protein